MILTSCNYKNLSGKEKEKFIEKSTDAIFSALFAKKEPGAAVMIVKNDSVVYAKGFGMARLDSMKPIDMNTAFNICSISKQFSAVALLKLAEDNLISLDDPIVNYFPNLTQSFFKDITLRHLLSHTSGIPDNRPYTEEDWVEYRKNHESKFNSIRDYRLFSEEDETLLYLEDIDSLNFKPGTQYEYMNPTYQMVLSIVEQATNEDFDDWMRDNIFLPAGMKHTVYLNAGQEIPNAAFAYDLAKGENIYEYFRSKDGKWEKADYGEANYFPTKADGGIYTTPLDFIKWNRALYSGEIISKESVLDAQTSKIQTDIPYTGYGYGWFIEQRPDRPEKVYHTGDNGGFYTFEGYYPDSDLFYLIFSNRPDWDREEAVEKIDKLFEEVGWIDNPSENNENK